MLILGVILMVLGFVVFQWAANAQSKSVFERPMIFNRAIAVIIINLIWIGLFIGGFYSLWQVSPKIVLTIIGIYAVLWVLGYFMGSEKAKAKKIFKIYRQLKLFRPKASDEEIFRETANAYFRGLRWDEDKIRMTVEAIFEKRVGSKEDKDIKDVASSVLIFESPHGDLMSYDFRKSMQRFSKKQKAIDDAYNTIIGNAPKVAERPELSENTVKWIKSIGFNPDEMTNEQLAVFSEIDDHGKSNWAVRFFYGASFVFLILAGINLISLAFVGILGNGFISFVFWYIGHKIQMKRISKKFYEASIMKYAQEQREEESKIDVKSEIEDWLNDRSALASKIKETFSSGDYERTLELSEKMLSMHDEDFNALCYNGTALAKLERHEQAIKVLDQCIKENGNMFFLWVTRGDCHYHLEYFEKAFNDYMMSLVLEPDNTAVVDKVARTLFRHGDVKRAVDYAKKAISKKESPEPFLVMATMLSENGYSHYAKEIIRMGGKAFPEDGRFTEFSIS